MMTTGVCIGGSAITFYDGITSQPYIQSLQRKSINYWRGFSQVQRTLVIITKCKFAQGLLKPFVSSSSAG